MTKNPTILKQEPSITSAIIEMQAAIDSLQRAVAMTYGTYCDIGSMSVVAGANQSLFQIRRLLIEARARHLFDQ